MTNRISTPVAWALIGGATILSAFVGTRANKRGQAWFRSVRKPTFQPPDAAFPIVWSALYTMSAASALRVQRAPPSPARQRALALWSVQLGLNAAWSPLFFGQQRPRAALADVVLLGATLGAYTLEARRVDRAAALLVVPYLAWVGFASVLNGAIVRRNPDL